mgnify:FL=1
MKKYVYKFYNNKAEGSASMQNLLGGKGANLAEMTNLKIPVPPGFTITTEACVYYIKHNKYPPGLKKQVNEAIIEIENFMNKNFGSNSNPLLFSVRSGARQSMPGMMETVLNIGLTNKTITGLIQQTNNPKFAYDSYRRLIMMYADVVMDKANDLKNFKIRIKLEKILEKIKSKKKYMHDSDIIESDLEKVCFEFKKKISNIIKDDFPDNPNKQLWGSIDAVFKSWNGTRAIKYRTIENLDHNWGTAVNIQCMVFGNMGNDSATGVGFTRNPATGEKRFFGEWLQNAQGEDVVAGIRTPHYIEGSKNDLKTKMPKMYDELHKIQDTLESHYKEMQDIEFTIENQKLWILQTRKGKRNGVATIKIALDMYKEKIITKNDLLRKIKPKHVNEMLLPTINYKKINNLDILTTGLPAGPGAASGQIVFTPEDAEEEYNKGNQVILVREETSPEDVEGMYVSEAILTARGGMTSHAALVARGWGKCCIVGCNEIIINEEKQFLQIGKSKIYKNSWITLNGSLGEVYLNKLPLVQPKVKQNVLFNKFLNTIKKHSNSKVRTNADTPKDAKQAISLGATGIGLCRTEHMFFDSKRIIAMRKMIVAKNLEDRQIALNELLPYQQKDFYQILKSMDGKPVTIRLLDPPLHEFLPTEKRKINLLAKKLKISRVKLEEIIESLHESNPMLGHRGCRLAVTYPEITQMQTAAIVKATEKLIKNGYDPKPEIMIPLVGSMGEFIDQKNIVQKTINSMSKEQLNIKIGTMIELPRACIIANQIAQHADFISFGTNDLTQTTFGFSRDDIGSFMQEYINKGILINDPFQQLDEEGVGELIKTAIIKAKKSNPKIKIGICGEHGGDPKSIMFLKSVGVDYMSCSPYRIPIAYLTLAQISSKKN